MATHVTTYTVIHKSGAPANAPSESQAVVSPFEKEVYRLDGDLRRLSRGETGMIVIHGDTALRIALAALLARGDRLVLLDGNEPLPSGGVGTAMGSAEWSGDEAELPRVRVVRLREMPASPEEVFSFLGQRPADLHLLVCPAGGVSDEVWAALSDGAGRARRERWQRVDSPEGALPAGGLMILSHEPLDVSVRRKIGCPIVFRSLNAIPVPEVGGAGGTEGASVHLLETSRGLLKAMGAFAAVAQEVRDGEIPQVESEAEVGA